MQREKTGMFVRNLSILGALAATMLASTAALAQSDPVASAIAGSIVGAAIATGAVVPYEHTRRVIHVY